MMRELEDETAFLPTIVIHELYKEQFETPGKDTAETRLNIILHSSFEIANLDVEIAKEAARLRCRYSTLPTADSIIAATAIATKSHRVVTDDPPLQSDKRDKDGVGMTSKKEKIIVTDEYDGNVDSLLD